MTSFNILADTISIIKNGQSSCMSKVSVPFSKFIYNFLLILKDEGYIGEIEIEEVTEVIKRITMVLKYYRSKAVIADFKVISKPSRRVYWSVKDFRSFYGGLGLFIVSTSKGILPVNKARECNVGGEVLCGIF